MAGAIAFHIDVVVKNQAVLDELKARTLDLSALFQKIYLEWVALNRDKFEASQGQEVSGVTFAGEPHWEPLSKGYHHAKQRAGYEDWLMVRTGDLARSMTNPELLFRALSPMDALFGTPLDPEDAAKVAYNWARRQVVFLGVADKNMIRANVQAFFQMGEAFETLMAGRTTQTQRNAEEAAMNMGFSNALAGDEGDWGDG